MPWSRIPIDPLETDRAERLRAEGRRTITYREALREALAQALETDPRVFLCGEGVDDPGGIFGTTRGLQERYGRERVFDTPLSENGMTGVAIGAALAGRRPVLVHQRVDFMLLTMDQLVNHAAVWRRMFGGRLAVPLTIRAVIGRGWGSAAQHSQNLQALFSHVPGLKVVMPATAYDAKGLLLAAIADPDPVIFLEHRWLYDTVDEVPPGAYLVPLGRAAVRRPGRTVTVAAVSHLVGEAEKAARLLAERGVEAEVIDLRTLRPLDLETVLASVRKTGRLVVADTGWRTGGVAAEVVAAVTERGFELLRKAPVRVACPDRPTPAAPELEKAYYPGVADILRAVEGVL